MKYPYLRALSVSLLAAALLFGSVPIQNSFHTKAATPKPPVPKFRSVESPNDFFIIRAGENGDATCHEANAAEARQLRRENNNEDLHIITPSIRPQGVNGLTITLRGTQQLENFPQAKAGFLKAAATWESIIQNKISVVIDVDFGTKWFDVFTFESNVIGATDPNIYPDQSDRFNPPPDSAFIPYVTAREALIQNSNSNGEKDICSALPQNIITTDKGNTTLVSGATANLRALGLLNADANPDTESSLGDPPGIGFNSAFAFDFDPSNGVDANKIDFDSVATHEIGHALGFTTMAARTSQYRGLMVWDLFRFAPGAALCNFTAAQRKLNIGGEQVFFAGCSELALSTGTDTAQGGDGNQTSHWKADEITGTTIGIMDPTISRGRQFTISNNDLAVLDIIGYQTIDHTTPCTGGGAAANIRKTTVDLSGITIVLKGEAFSNCMQIEINGVFITPQKLKVKGEGAKAVISGTSAISSLNLVFGQNQIRVRTNGTFSNTVTFTL